MTEAEYIKVRDLSNLITAKNALSQITPSVSDIIDVSEYNFIMSLLSEWERKHFDSIQTTSD